MNKILLVSPHFDDAVLSAGQLMAGRPDCDVVTVFAGYPLSAEKKKTEYDKKCGFNNALDAVSMRRREDLEALSLLRAKPIHWEFTDEQYGESFDDATFEYMLLDRLKKIKYEFMVVPLGLGHPDHIVLSDIIRELQPQIKIPVYYWEDLPLRVVQPELVPPRLEELGLKKLVSIGDGPIANKIRSLTCYRSQIGTGILDPYLMYVPERFWT